MKTNDGNKVIGLFLGYHIGENFLKYDTGTSPSWSIEKAAGTEMTYHSDWNELIKAIRKINELEEKNTVYYNQILLFLVNLDIERCWNAVIEFIQHIK